MSTNHDGQIIGLTGGIATGKSTVARFLREFGVVVIDADELARRVVEPGQPALEEIVDAFGPEVLAEDGTLDRNRLGEKVFRDDEARTTLENITHPRIAEAMFKRAEEAFHEGHRWVVYDAALLVETGTHRMLAALIVVDCSPTTQLKRLMGREEIDEEAARRRIDAQMPLDEKRQIADYIIDNDGSLEETRRQVHELKQRIDERIDTHGTAKPPPQDHG